MTMDADSAVPLACVPGAIPAEERAGHFALAAELFGGAVQARRALEDGYAFRFAPERLDGVMRFVANERRCCPFLELTLTVSPSGGPVWLRMRGPAGTRAFLEAELRL
ncbi:MAG TPA: hypothetical protein VFY65_06975 [Longimicrobium sp.]|nr:hypothetical protein [Longimicrobium sp.]